MVNGGNNKMMGNNKFGESLFIKKGAEPRDSAPPLMETKWFKRNPPPLRRGITLLIFIYKRHSGHRAGS